MVSIDLEATFALIREKRDRLNIADDAVLLALRHVESALVAQELGVPVETHCPPPALIGEVGAYWLFFEKRNGQWRLLWSRSREHDPQPLASAPRRIRACVFMATDEGPSAIELLILAIADTIVKNISERGPAVAFAQNLSEALHVLGYARPT